MCWCVCVGDAGREWPHRLWEAKIELTRRKLQQETVKSNGSLFFFVGCDLHTVKSVSSAW
jgi:hypothetical protein